MILFKGVSFYFILITIERWNIDLANASPTTKVIPSFDPFDVKEQLVELAQDYFNLDEIDTYESGFMGYLIQALTYLTSDVLYQNALSYLLW